MRLVKCCLLGILLATFPSWGDVASSKHNLSISGPGKVVAASQSEICIFCHTPHGASPSVPLWNHASTRVGTYAMYSSTTLEASTSLGQPTGSSKLCLSCHDGTVALGQTLNDGLIALLNAGPGGRMPAGASVLGTDLTDDHPISFARNPSSTEVSDPPAGDEVRLDPDGQIQCTSCHDPHVEDRDPISRKFLVKRNRGSALCRTCHAIDYWNGSAHQSSTAPYTRRQGAHTGYETVADNGCESCHRPHSANEPQRLLKLPEEETCLVCHDGSVASKNIAAEFAKPFAHPTLTKTPSVHDAAESPLHPSATLPEVTPAAQRHAECQDCHNPHASRPGAGGPGRIPGSLAGTWGISAEGALREAALSTYEICYKCHADAANKPQEAGLPNPPYPARLIAQFNTRLEFDPSNPSHHAIEAPGKNPDVPSLLPGYTTASTIECTDCHNSDSSSGSGGRGARGPHGSVNRWLLEMNLIDGSRNHGSDFGHMYAMCFKCHSQASIMSDESFKEHRRHVEGEGTSCLVCHDPHGVSATQGNSSGNSHLINFDLRVVQRSRTGEIRFEERGQRKGACYLRCHDVEHDPLSY